mmetsp:Transcript_60753/g.107943  ORF Transcript_60753/g.107943 Transcript_60753/m.107943 type:complete len:168 (+) Transcript_60753:2334-2837(+)
MFLCTLPGDGALSTLPGDAVLSVLAGDGARRTLPGEGARTDVPLGNGGTAVAAAPGTVTTGTAVRATGDNVRYGDWIGLPTDPTSRERPRIGVLCLPCDEIATTGVLDLPSTGAPLGLLSVGSSGRAILRTWTLGESLPPGRGTYEFILTVVGSDGVLAVFAFRLIT